MKPYLVTYKFYYDGECRRTRTNTILCESPGEDTEYSGTDFEGLWDLTYEWEYLIPIDTYITKKNKRHMYIYGELKNITPKNCKPWKFTITYQDTTISMERLMQFDSEKVIQYLKERGITTCPILK